MDISIFDFFRLRLENGIQLKKVNLGSIGLLIMWALSVAGIYFVAWYRFTMRLFNHISEITPAEVREMLFHMACDGKDELTIRGALERRGWIDGDDQTLALEALGVQIAAMEMARQT